MRKERGFTLLELLIVVVILGVLALIAAPTLLNAADKAKEGAVKANVSAAASSVTTQLTVEEKDADDAASDAADDLNAAGTTDDTSDDAKSPFSTADDAFVAAAAAAAAGQVTLDGTDGEYAVTITGYDKNTEALDGAKKTVSAPQEATS
ncbi:MAG: prepilin-type N-terminal cleavage/methylation domain-containing protein [Cyanobacteriota bacterium]